MMYRVCHVTRYDYGSSVDLGAHMLHLQPRALPWQRVLSAGVRIEPSPTRRHDGLDHFGNMVAWVFLDARHPSFEATSQAVVEVRFPAAPPAGETPPWEEVAAAAWAGDGGGGWEAAEFLFESPMVPNLPEAGAYAAPSFPPGRPVLEGLLDLLARIRRDFTFRSGVTSLSTPVSRVLERRQGVCQDFTHLMISALRTLGLPARYTSGYIRTYPPPGMPRRQGADQSHAWVGCWLGPAHGWIDLDPTNNLVVQDEHVVVAWGRDYSDISPVRGIILGGGRTHGMTVSVDLEPLDEAA